MVKDVTWRERLSWVVWEEGKGPNVVIEVLSDSTADVDRVEKKRVYQDEVQVPEYFWYDPKTCEACGFRLAAGRYQPIPRDAAGMLFSQQLGLKLRTWEGVYRGEPAVWLRWGTPDGVLLPTGEEDADEARRLLRSETERADAEQRRADAERRRANATQGRVSRLSERLRALGIDPDDEGELPGEP